MAGPFRPKELQATAARTRTPSSRSGRLLIVLAVALVTTLSTATGAQAHTGLATSNPPADTTVTAPIDAVQLTFTGSVLLRDVTVTGPDGASAVSGPGAASGSVVTAPVAPTTAGTHTVTYAMTSGDGHALEGSLSFGFAPPIPAAPPADTTTTAPTTTAGPLSGEPSEAASGSTAEDAGGLPSWVVPVLLGGVVVVLAVLIVLRRARTRG